MSIFLDIIDQHARTDLIFEQAIIAAIATNDDAAFDEENKRRSHND